MGRAPTIPVLIALGSNVGDRRRYLRDAIHNLRGAARLVRISSVYETAPLQATAGSPAFLNLVAVGFTHLEAAELLNNLHRIEEKLGRRRRLRNEPRVIDLDLILYGATLQNTSLQLPHPRFRSRNFVLAPMRELALQWVDPVNGKSLNELRGEGAVRRVGSLY